MDVEKIMKIKVTNKRTALSLCAFLSEHYETLDKTEDECIRFLDLFYDEFIKYIPSYNERRAIINRIEKIQNNIETVNYDIFKLWQTIERQECIIDLTSDKE